METFSFDSITRVVKKETLIFQGQRPLLKLDLTCYAGWEQGWVILDPNNNMEVVDGFYKKKVKTIYEGQNGSILETTYPDGEVIFDVLPTHLDSVPESHSVWEGKGYSGGHTSQSHWDTEQECRQIKTLLKEGFFVKNLTSTGSTGGYYPKVAYWK